MRSLKIILPLLLLLPALFSCNKDLNVNAGWKDITVVYGLLDQSQDTTYIKITKAYLGPGDAMTFAKNADSSNYPDKLEVRLDEYNGTDFVSSYPCDTVTIHNKKKGDSIFYYPDQLMYFSMARLDETHIYKLFIRNKKTGKEITAQTELVHDFEIIRPQTQVPINFDTVNSVTTRWKPAKNGTRYQLLIRFYYLEALKSDSLNPYTKFVDWVVYNNIPDPQNTLSLDIAGLGFYTVVGASVPVSNDVIRKAQYCKFIYSVASATLNTYIEVTEPSMTIVQEKPSFTNITNGLGIFSSRYTKILDSLWVGSPTRALLKKSGRTKNRGF
ncbi:MAG: hypothetical protein WCK34_10840 [Bacteroidota bacterium]